MSVETRVYGELNDFLPQARRGRVLTTRVAAGTTVKDLAESLGVPHPEIDVILVNGQSVEFGQQISDGDQVGVYPFFETAVPAPILHLRPRVSGEPRFVIDVHLGRLARYLRLLGFDAVWRNDTPDKELAAISLHDKRILLTRDRGLLKRGAVTYGYYVRETGWRLQVAEVLRRFDLYDAIEPFGQCLECNGHLESVPKTEIEDRLPPRTRHDYGEFRRCPDCGRIYWKGSHYDRLRAVVDDIRREGRDGVRARTPYGTSESALEACGRGWSVVPLHNVTAGRCSCGDPSCPAPGKHPRIAWDRLTREAATPDEVERWWRRWPQSNLGLVTGAVSGLVVVDVDPRHGGGDTLVELESVHGGLPHTVESLTGGGGQHFYFRHPGIRVASRPVAPGLDVKGDGGLVVCPPSIHATGRSYVWETGCEPGTTALADVPSWLLALALDAGDPERRERRAAAEMPPRTEGERHEFAELWADIGIALEPGDHYYLCPFHDDHHPSLHIDAERCRFYCFGCTRGGGAGRLRRLVGVHHGVRGPNLPDARPPDPGVSAQAESEPLTLTGRTEIDVVGESRYQDALLELTGGRRHYGGVRMRTVARLVPEPDGAEPGAIAVTIAGRTVGWLSRADAARQHDTVVAAIQHDGRATCTATIVGGWEREHGDIGYFGVRLQF
ncbi:MAG: Mut7-C RNAse domain-containing protein [Acidimicrobiales bacterium]